MQKGKQLNDNMHNGERRWGRDLSIRTHKRLTIHAKHTQMLRTKTEAWENAKKIRDPEQNYIPL